MNSVTLHTPCCEQVRSLALDEAHVQRLLSRLPACTLTAAKGEGGRSGWRTVDSLALPTAMHAHSAITVPLLPSGGSPAAEGASQSRR